MSSSSPGRASPGLAGTKRKAEGNGVPSPGPRTSGGNLGAPRLTSKSGRYFTRGGIAVDCDVRTLPDSGAAYDALVSQLDTHRGCCFESSYEFPGRYARWTMGFVNPPLVLEATGRTFTITALNERGRVLVPPMHAALVASDSLSSAEADGDAAIRGVVRPIEGTFAEEERSRQHSIFSVVRVLTELFYYNDEPQLGLYGAFGYDLTFQFEPTRLKQSRDASQRDLVLYLPDEILLIDIHTRTSWTLTYEFSYGGKSSAGLPRTGAAVDYAPAAEADIPRRRDHAAGDFAAKVARAKEEFKVGNLFECVLSQARACTYCDLLRLTACAYCDLPRARTATYTRNIFTIAYDFTMQCLCTNAPTHGSLAPTQTFFEPSPQPPSSVFRRLRTRNPSPYGFLINLGGDLGD